MSNGLWYNKVQKEGSFMLKLPKGNSNFVDIVTKGFVYVDKTKYIEMLENGNDKFVHFLRPRRFGKTLFISMLSCYYDILTKDNFDVYFKDTYIHEHPTVEKNSYLILPFDFSGLNDTSSDMLEREFTQRIEDQCKEFLNKYKIDIELEKRSAAGIISQLLYELPSKTDIPIYAIIDEYDQFSNELISFDLKGFKNIVSKNGYVRKFYETLKIGTSKGVVKRIFMTGVSPITLDSMTSGFNISTNLSLDPRYHSMMGFDKDEMYKLILEIDEIVNKQAVLQDMKIMYDGYCFTKKKKECLFNPNMVFYYFDQRQIYHEAPIDMIDSNMLSDYNKLESLLMINSDQKHKDILLEILSKEKITCELTTSFCLDVAFTRDDFISLLYYLGYLTIHSVYRDMIEFTVPNTFIKKIYFDYFRKMIQLDFHVNTSNYAESINRIIDQKDNSLFVSNIEGLLKSLDNRDFRGFSESKVKIAAAAIAQSNKYVLLKSEYPVEEGYVDIVLFPYHTQGITALFELKYIKKENLNQATLEEKRKEAYLQLKKYGEAKEFANQDIVKWILIFSKDECVCNEIVD